MPNILNCGLLKCVFFQAPFSSLSQSLVSRGCSLGSPSMVTRYNLFPCINTWGHICSQPRTFQWGHQIFDMFRPKFLQNYLEWLETLRVLLAFKALFMQETFRICLQSKQSWREIWRLLSFAIKIDHYVICTMLFSKNLNRCFVVLYKMEILSIPLLDNWTERCELCFSQIGPMMRWLACVRSMEE